MADYFLTNTYFFDSIVCYNFPQLNAMYGYRYRYVEILLYAV